VGPGCQARRGHAQLGRLGRRRRGGGEAGATRFGPKTTQPRGGRVIFLFSISLPFLFLFLFISFSFEPTIC
jgi:hypothetical protein